jgi:hypothetical protein
MSTDEFNQGIDPWVCVLSLTFTLAKNGKGKDVPLQQERKRQMCALTESLHLTNYL